MSQLHNTHSLYPRKSSLIEKNKLVSHDSKSTETTPTNYREKNVKSYHVSFFHNSKSYNEHIYTEQHNTEWMAALPTNPSCMIDQPWFAIFPLRDLTTEEVPVLGVHCSIAIQLITCNIATIIRFLCFSSLSVGENLELGCRLSEWRIGGITGTMMLRTRRIKEKNWE